MLFEIFKERKEVIFNPFLLHGLVVLGEEDLDYVKSMLRKILTDRLAKESKRKYRFECSE